MPAYHITRETPRTRIRKIPRRTNMGCIPGNNCIPSSYCDVRIVTTNSRVLHATDNHVHPSRTGHISCERLVLVLSRGSSVCRSKLLKKRMRSWVTTNYPIAAHVIKRIIIVPQCGWRCSKHWWWGSWVSFIRVFVGLLGMYVSHSRCLFVVCTTISLAKEEPMTNILGLGEERDLNPCPWGPDMLWETLILHILPCIHNQTVCSCPLFSRFIRTDRRAKSMTRRLRPQFVDIQFDKKFHPFRSGGRSPPCEGLSLTDTVLSSTWN